MQPHEAPRKSSRPRCAGLLPLILALALLRGLLYLAVMPPWQHYDEPTHFEYIRLLAERGRLPQPGDYDLEMRREIAASMQAADFWKDMGRPALDLFSATPPNIGITELPHPPLYYLLLALPQALLRYQDVETQLYVARLGSVLLYLVVVAAVYALAVELFPRRPGLALTAAGLVAFLPTMTDLMSSVNNDVGAAAAATLFLWATVRLLRRGPSPGRVVALLLLAGACVTTKSTSGLVALTGLLGLAGSWLHARRPWLPWAVAGLALAGLLVIALDWQQYASSWYDGRLVGGPLRQRTAAPLGDFALVLSPAGEEHPSIVVQELPPARGRALAGHPVTLGAWLRGSGEEDQRAELRLRDASGVQSHEVALTGEWRFASFTATVAAGSPTVQAMVAIPPGAAGQLVYADGLILVPGTYDREGTPQFAGDDAKRATWHGQEVTNLLHNGSAEAAWPGFRSWLRSARVYRMGVQEVLHAVLDWRRTGWVYRPELEVLHRSFWGSFAWGHLSLPDAWFYPPAALALAAAAGVALGLVRHNRGRPATSAWKHRACWILGLTLLVTAAGTILRIHPVYILVHIFWPVARYLTVAIGLLAIVLCGGLAELLPRRWWTLAGGAGLLGLVVLDAAALWTIILPYYYG